MRCLQSFCTKISDGSTQQEKEGFDESDKTSIIPSADTFVLLVQLDDETYCPTLPSSNYFSSLLLTREGLLEELGCCF